MKWERWYFELVLKNSDLTNNQVKAFSAGLENKVERWYFELVLKIPNLTDYQVWAFN